MAQFYTIAEQVENRPDGKNHEEPCVLRQERQQRFMDLMPALDRTGHVEHYQRRGDGGQCPPELGSQQAESAQGGDGQVALELETDGP